LGEIAKRGAERAERSETPGSKPVRRIRQRCQSSRRALQQPARAARRGGNWRKPPAKTLLGKLSAFSLSHVWGALQSSTSTSLAEIAEIGFRRSGRCASQREVFTCSARRARSSRSRAAPCSRLGDLASSANALGRQLGTGRAALAGAERCIVRLPKGHGPSVLPAPCATPRVASGIQGRDLK
jgi:hypothetical protein